MLLTCPSCRTVLAVPDTFTGKVTCPKCGQHVDTPPPLPLATTVHQVRCYDCGQFFPSDQIVRELVTTQTRSDVLGKPHQKIEEKVDLCGECSRKREREKLINGILILVVFAFFVLMWLLRR